MIRRQFLGRVTTAAICLFTTGCSSDTQEPGKSRLTRRTLERIRGGMTFSQVEEILGPVTEKGGLSPNLDAYCLWLDGDRAIEVLFDSTGCVQARGARVIVRGYHLD
jgi:hypothetical protein